MTSFSSNLKPSALTFLPMHTVRIIERTSILQQKDGITTRILTETVLVEVNQNTLTETMRENNALKKQLEENGNKLMAINDLITIIISVCILLCKMYGLFNNE